LDCRMPDGGSWKLGPASGVIDGKAAVSISGNILQPARKRFHVMVESAPMREPRKVEASLQRWRATGRPVHTFEAGTISYLDDKTTISWDGRVLFIGVGLFDDRDAATKLVDELSGLGSSSWILEEVLSKTQGTVSLQVNGRRVASGNNGLQLIPAGTIELKNVEFARGYTWHGYATRSFHGPLTISWGAQDAMDAVFETDLETILAGVVPSEISSNAAPSALQAQAVAARGEILSKMGLRHLGEGFDFCAEQHCQVYAGETAASRKLEPLLAPTRGMLLRNSEGAIVDAVYAANCGGHGEANHLVWTSPPDPQLSGVWDTTEKPPRLDLTKERDVALFIRTPPDCWCSDASVEGGDKFRWRKSLSRTAWKKVEEAADIGRISDVTDFERGPSGRLFKITLKGEKGTKTIMKELAIRKLFGGLRSACFVADWKRDASGYLIGAEFIGAGWGHGVGMCQTGAQAMAKAGNSFNRILAHYFPGGKIEKIY
ncbi:MAG TPA: SpoIID/LytB domain-containing protein, partial [Candidatus Ozemobacteraceae bacterium]|nr:SpoIID/LytB domain-containing protein [Candidatus Ozemobacteraceae bacterium]